MMSTKHRYRIEPLIQSRYFTMSLEKAKAALDTCREAQFDYDVVETFLEICRDFVQGSVGDEAALCTALDGISRMVDGLESDAVASVWENIGWELSEMVVEVCGVPQTKETCSSVCKLLHQAASFAPAKQVIFSIVKGFQAAADIETASSAQRSIYAIALLSCFSLCLSRMTDRQRPTFLGEYKHILMSVTDSLLESDYSDVSILHAEEKVDGVQGSQLRGCATDDALVLQWLTAIRILIEQEVENSALHTHLLDLVLATHGQWIIELPLSNVSTYSSILKEFSSIVTRLVPDGDLVEFVGSATRYAEVRMQIEAMGATVNEHQVMYRGKQITPSGELKPSAQPHQHGTNNGGFDDDGWSEEEEEDIGADEVDLNDLISLTDELCSIPRWDVRGITAFLFCRIVESEEKIDISSGEEKKEGKEKEKKEKADGIPALPMHEYFPFVILLLSESNGHSAMVEKGVLLLSRGLTATISSEIDEDMLNPYSYWVILRLLSTFMVQWPDKAMRNSAFGLFRGVLTLLTSSARFKVYEYFVRSCPFPSVSALLLHRLKEDVDFQMTTREMDRSEFDSLSLSVVHLLTDVLKAPPKLLLERADVVSGALNVVRYLTIKAKMAPSDGSSSSLFPLLSTVGDERPVVLAAVTDLLSTINTAMEMVSARMESTSKAEKASLQPTCFALSMMQGLAERTSELLTVAENTK